MNRKENLKKMLLALGLSLEFAHPTYANEIENTNSFVLEANDENNDIENIEESQLVEDLAEESINTEETLPMENTVVTEEVDLYSDEEILQKVLQIYGETYEEFYAIAVQVMDEAAKNHSPYGNIYGVAREFYRLSEIPKEEKLEVVLPYFGINYQGFDLVQAVFAHESKYADGSSYSSGYFLANHICSRLNSKLYVASAGANIISQITAKRQYEVYARKLYVRHLNTWTRVTDALLDRMFVEACEGEFQLYTNPYLGFRANSYSGKVFISKDNSYRDLQNESDRIKARPERKQILTLAYK